MLMNCSDKLNGSESPQWASWKAETPQELFNRRPQLPRVLCIAIGRATNRGLSHEASMKQALARPGNPPEPIRSAT